MTARWFSARLGEKDGNVAIQEASLRAERRRVFPRHEAGSLQKWC